jgi:hypothetical protein
MSIDPVTTPKGIGGERASRWLRSPAICCPSRAVRTAGVAQSAGTAETSKNTAAMGIGWDQAFRAEICPNLPKPAFARVSERRLPTEAQRAKVGRLPRATAGNPSSSMNCTALWPRRTICMAARKWLSKMSALSGLKSAPLAGQKRRRIKRLTRQIGGHNRLRFETAKCPHLPSSHDRAFPPEKPVYRRAP